jgi:hypothetical protein
VVIAEVFVRVKGIALERHFDIVKVVGTVNFVKARLIAEFNHLDFPMEKLEDLPKLLDFKEEYRLDMVFEPSIAFFH